MKKLFYAIIAALVVIASFQGCVSKKDIASNPKQPVTSKIGTTESKITKEIAYEGVSNYCHEAYDWSIAEDNPAIMYLEMGEESETEYEVIFHSYTGAIVYFHVNKLNGTARMTEYVPILNIENEAGAISIYDYLKRQD